MRRPSALKSTAGIKCAASLLVALLAGCSRKEPEPPPVLSPWAEQAAAAERAVRGRDLMLTGAGGVPTRNPGKPYARGGPIELKVYVSFANPKASQLPDEREPRYEALSVRFNDHRLAATLKVEESRRGPEDEKIPGGLGAVRFGPQDVLKATLAEGETYMGTAVDAGNIDLALLQPSLTPPDLSGRAIWKVVYYHAEDVTLSIFVDALTGAIVKREKKTWTGETGASPSPSPKP
ncbi:MAG TPA: hypothetical protein VN256_27715 [Pyrinomonadaceae bacterium]|nr:hypothetical protein [Pyrinomonadaceae bacterium]